jgi:alpha-beta hydrolase superfamily lysophospholipase
MKGVFSMNNQGFLTFLRRRWLLLIFLALISLVASLFLPWNVGALTSHPHPVQSYDEAVQRIAALRADRTALMNPDCLVQFMTHGQKVQHAIVLVHGYTSCPAQFQQLGQRFYDQGYNVLIAPLPHHGLADRMTDEQGQLTVEELAAYADEMVDIAHGLGEQVTMMGISAGGVTTAWAAQNRSDLDLAIMISPAFGFKALPTPLTGPVMNVSLLLPDAYTWWDPVMQESLTPLHAYPRYSKHALAQTLRIGFAVRSQAGQQLPAARRIMVITNANDTTVNNPLTAEVVAVWRQRGANISTYEFPASLGLGHDLIDPAQHDQQIGIVYPQLIDLATH